MYFSSQSTNDQFSLHERHVQTLKETLESPLWPSTIDSIRAVILQLETYDPVLCDPRRDFRIIYHKGSVVAAIKGDNGDLQEEMEHELSEALGLNLTDLCLWEEWVSVTNFVMGNHVLIEPLALDVYSERIVGYELNGNSRWTTTGRSLESIATCVFLISCREIG